MTDCTPVSASPVRISTIYALLDADGNVRYVGITVSKLQARLRRHLWTAHHCNDKTYRSNWLRSLPEPPKIVEIEQTYDREREKFWITHYKELGCKLTNRTDGGEGAPGLRHTAESIARMKKYHDGKKLTGEHRAAIGNGQRGKVTSAETKLKMSAVQKGRVFSDEHRAKMSATIRQKYQDDPSMRERVGEQSRARLQDPAYRANLAKAHKGCAMSADARAKISAVHKGRIFTPEHRANMSRAQKRRKSTSDDRTQGTLDIGN